MTDPARCTELKELALAAGWSQKEVDRTRPMDIQERLKAIPLPTDVIDYTYLFDPQTQSQQPQQPKPNPKSKPHPKSNPQPKPKPKPQPNPKPQNEPKVKDQQDIDMDDAQSLWWNGREMLDDDITADDRNFILESMNQNRNIVIQLYRKKIDSLKLLISKKERMLNMCHDTSSPMYATTYAHLQFNNEQLSVTINQLNDFIANSSQ